MISKLKLFVFVSRNNNTAHTINMVYGETMWQQHHSVGLLLYTETIQNRFMEIYVGKSTCYRLTNMGMRWRFTFQQHNDLDSS